MQNHAGTSMQEEWFWNEQDMQWDEYTYNLEGDLTYPSGNWVYWGNSVFDTSMMYLSTNWQCYEGLVGGSEDSILSIHVSHIIPNVEYRFQLYYQIVPVTPAN
jgi:hypothetical protein